MNEQYVPRVLTKTNGDMVIGIAVNLKGEGVILNAYSFDPAQRASATPMPLVPTVTQRGRASCRVNTRPK
ncbi:MAG: hypothetical protein WCL08_07475 [Verrucomicrobiota bacterium]